MPSQFTAKRTGALLATAALTLTGLTLTSSPLAHATSEPTNSLAAASASATHVTNNATLSWALKDSFIKYVTGAFAGGTITVTDGPTFNGSSFAWEGATGEFTGANGTINYPGTIHITAHKGALDITYTNIKLVINGTSGTLVMDVKSKGYNGSPDIDSTAVNFATVDLSGIAFKAGTISANQAPTALTADGAAAFAGFYKAGDVLAPLTFSATLTEKPA
ncbi:HtaA domain-containing protein, partial [Rothia nasimurium]